MRAEAHAGAEGASWAGLTAPLGDATWIRSQKGTGSMSPHWISVPRMGTFSPPDLLLYPRARIKPE